MPTIAYPHIEIRQDGIPWIEGTETKVVEIVMSRMAHGWDADEIQRQLPHLTLAQIYAALGYYHDNQAEVDADIQRRLRRIEEIREQFGDSPIRLKLLAAKRAALGLKP